MYLWKQYNLMNQHTAIHMVYKCTLNRENWILKVLQEMAFDKKKRKRSRSKITLNSVLHGYCFKWAGRRLKSMGETHSSTLMVKEVGGTQQVTFSFRDNLSNNVTLIYYHTKLCWRVDGLPLRAIQYKRRHCGQLQLPITVRHGGQ